MAGDTCDECGMPYDETELSELEVIRLAAWVESLGWYCPPCWELVANEVRADLTAWESIR